MTTLVLSPKQARILHAVLNMSNVKGWDSDELSAEDMALENLIGKGYTYSEEDVSKTVWAIWETLDKKEGK